MCVCVGGGVGVVMCGRVYIIHYIYYTGVSLGHPASNC